MFFYVVMTIFLCIYLSYLHLENAVGDLFYIFWKSVLADWVLIDLDVAVVLKMWISGLEVEEA